MGNNQRSSLWNIKTAQSKFYDPFCSKEIKIFPGSLDQPLICKTNFIVVSEFEYS